MSHRRIHLGAHWGEWTDFESLVQFARTAERGLFDFLVGGPDTATALAALATVTDRLGLVGTVDTTRDDPVEVARRFVTLDHLSDGRSGIRLSDVESDSRAAEFVSIVRALWDSWEPDAVRADERTGVYVDPTRIHPIDHRGPHFDVRDAASLPTRRHGPPVLLQNKAFPIVTVAAGEPAERIAAEMDSAVQSGACDGFILAPPRTPDDLAEFVDAVVPALQDRGAFRTEYDGTTLREHLRP